MTTGVLYSLSMDNGEIKVQTGLTIPDKDGIRKYVRCTVEGHGKVTCPYIPGEVHNSRLWLHERDDILARGLFIEHAKNQIEDLSKKINRQYKKLELLKGCNIDD